MIRDYQPEDSAVLLEMLQQPGGHKITSPASIAESLASSQVLVYEDGAVKGFSLIESGKTVSQVILFTNPALRCQGVGSALWQASLDALESKDPEIIWVFYRHDIGSSRDFYAARGCQFWYAYDHMIYNGPAFDEPALHWRLVEDTDFDRYYQSRTAAFAGVFHDLDEAASEEKQRENVRRYLDENRQNVYLFFDGEALIGSLAVVDNSLLDEIFVSPEYKGQGYGKSLVHFGVNRILEKGLKPTLAVVTTNITARKLYDRVGFELIQTLGMSRLFRK